jgi:hypothetical protein
MSVEIAKRLFNVREYERMIEAGILTKYDRVELIEGEIVEISPIGPRRAACVSRLNAPFAPLQKFGRDTIVGVRSPVRLGDHSEPQPDISLLKWRDDFYGQGHPQASDVLLLIEVSDATLKYDRQIKVPHLRARGGRRPVGR